MPRDMTNTRMTVRRVAGRTATLTCLVLLGACLMPSAAEQPGEEEAPLLTLDEAISQAIANNQSVKISSLEAEKSDHLVSIARSQRLPLFHVDVLAGSLVHPFDFTFPAGSFGNYPGVGPIPSTDSAITTPAQFTSVITAAVDQPLTQQHRIHLNMAATDLGREIVREDVRATRQRVVAEVRSAYYALVAAQTALQAARETVKTLEEVQRVTTEHEAQQAVLHADALEVGARLAKSRYDLSAAEDRLATQGEILNDLLGRDLTTRFRVEPIPEQEGDGLTLETVRQRAMESRPELRQAELKEKQAEYDRRLARAEYIPDLSLSVRYVGYENFEVLPQSVTTAGVYLSWEPFDWGRRRNRVAEKSLAVEQAHNGARQTRSQVAIDAGTKFRASTEAALLVRAALAGREAAREQLRVTTDQYQQQATLLKDLLQVQTRSVETEFQYQQALSSYWSAMADLRRAMGEE